MNASRPAPGGRSSVSPVPEYIVLYVRWVEAVNRVVGRGAMYLIIAMVGILSYSAIMRNGLQPAAVVDRRDGAIPVLAWQSLFNRGEIRCRCAPGGRRSIFQQSAQPIGRACRAPRDPDELRVQRHRRLRRSGELRSEPDGRLSSRWRSPGFSRARNQAIFRSNFRRSLILRSI